MNSQGRVGRTDPAARRHRQGAEVCFRNTLSDVRFRGNSGKHLLVLSFSQFDPHRTLATPKLFYLSSPSVEFRQLHWRILIFGGIIGRNFQKTFCFLDLRQFRPLAKADQGWSKQLAGGLSPACRLIELCK